ncbi:hypothetical protein B0H15DRAFT_266886 [Mycena belliarum]|uniref:Uncharacterized protein n=1 Tax=Mycena belliarum TaxID=1033014 RepID=A0AAD6XPI0_9AGAR|nr:hypothetical protein B0H15DRAFT_266886 [Mycena belliae]
MDDPWASPWGEPPTTSKRPSAPVLPLNDVDDEEDITIPSWEAPAVNWSDENSLWGARSPALDKFPSWQSPYDDLPLGKPSVSPPTPLDAPDDVSDTEAPGDSEVASEAEAELALESPAVPPFAPSSFEPSPFEPPPFEPVFEPSIPLSPTRSPPGSPDAFGTFESGLDDLAATSDPWTASHAALASDSADSAWGPAWAPSDIEHEGAAEAPVVDEWEAAKRQKAMQDKHVPPELLASILLQFTEFASELYPPLPTQPSDPDDYRASRHKALQGIDSLNPTILRILPSDLTLPPPRPFLKSAIAKKTSDALRLSRSAAFVRFSPLSHYGATKGSTAWETSVKRRPEAIGEADLLPPGWRILETKKDDISMADKKKTGHGGLLSFFGRRAGTPPVVASGEGVTPRSSSPASGSSPRASIDSVKSGTPSVKSPTNASSAGSAAPSTAVSPTTLTGAPPAPPPPPVIPINSQEDAGADTDPNALASTSSRVSRFLGRFGRKAPAATGPQNLALSEGDFDFLADIEGNVSGPNLDMIQNGHFPNTGALLDAPVPLPEKLSPPPRAPVPVPAIIPHVNGIKGRSLDADENSNTYTPPPLIKPSAPPLANRVSTPTPVPKTTSMSPVDSDIDFSAWGFDDEEKSSAPVKREPASVGPARQSLNTRAPMNTKSVVPQPRRAPTAIMSYGPSKPAVVPKLDATFGFLPPPRTQTQTPIASFPPPPGKKAVTASASLFDDDDEFSDFHAPLPIPPPNPSANSLYDASFSSSTSSERGLFSSTSSSSIPTNLFDDFDDFMQVSPQEPGTLRTPSPPRPPAKPARILNHTPALPPPLSHAPTPTDDDTPLALISSSSLRSKRAAANHQRALSLVENAAATSGVRWPAPQSPLPEALPPPPNQSDPFGFGVSSMQSQQAAFLNAGPPALRAFPPPPTRAMSPPVTSPMLSRPPSSGAQRVAGRFPPPPGSIPVLSPPGGTQILIAPALALPTPPPLSSTAQGKSSGGLSAQDLSFFEGL